ncbi:hypothetical protein V8F20_001306 [Naviculisporaceae sp. PSN 640]
MIPHGDQTHPLSPFFFSFLFFCLGEHVLSNFFVFVICFIGGGCGGKEGKRIWNGDRNMLHRTNQIKTEVSSVCNWPVSGARMTNHCPLSWSSEEQARRTGSRPLNNSHVPWNPLESPHSGGVSIKPTPALAWFHARPVLKNIFGHQGRI